MKKKEDFHKFLWAYCEIFTKNVYSAKDKTYLKLKWLIEDDILVVIPGDKDSCVIIMDKRYYISKMEEISDGLQKVVYVEIEGNRLWELKLFQDFLYQNVKNNEHYNKMYPTFNQPAQLYGTAKTHKQENIQNIMSLKLLKQLSIFWTKFMSMINYLNNAVVWFSRDFFWN